MYNYIHRYKYDSICVCVIISTSINPATYCHQFCHCVRVSSEYIHTK